MNKMKRLLLLTLVILLVSCGTKNDPVRYSDEEKEIIGTIENVDHENRTLKLKDDEKVYQYEEGLEAAVSYQEKEGNPVLLKYKIGNEGKKEECYLITSLEHYYEEEEPVSYPPHRHPRQNYYYTGTVIDVDETEKTVTVEGYDEERVFHSEGVHSISVGNVICLKYLATSPDQIDEYEILKGKEKDFLRLRELIEIIPDKIVITAYTYDSKYNPVTFDHVLTDPEDIDKTLEITEQMILYTEGEDSPAAGDVLFGMKLYQNDTEIMDLFERYGILRVNEDLYYRKDSYSLWDIWDIGEQNK